MRDFKPQYCALLINQIEEEILYLRQHGHNTRYPLKKCIFCTEYKTGYICTRIDQLNQFLSEIIVIKNMKPVPTIPEITLTQSDLLPKTDKAI